MNRCSNVKNNKSADELRSIGNFAFTNGNLFDALVLYNRSICLSETGSLSIALAYANRSAIYFRTTNYRNCLNNIELAKQNNYPKEKFPKLMERKCLCLQLLKSKKPNPEEDPWTFFKLSYPSNPKIPFIIDCLELTEGENNAQVIKTNKCLKFGDIISMEPPFYSIIDHKSAYIKCANCFSSNLLDLIPCKMCVTSEYSF